MADRNALMDGLWLDPVYDEQTGLGEYGQIVPAPPLQYGGRPVVSWGQALATGVGIGAGGAGGASVARGIWRVPAAVAGTVGGAAAGAAILAGGRNLPNLSRSVVGTEKARDYLDDSNAVVPMPVYPTSVPEGAQTNPLLAGLYGPMDRVTDATGQALNEASAIASAQGRQSPVGYALGHLMGYGLQGAMELPGAVMRTISYPYDRWAGNRTDATAGDVLATSLAAAAPVAGSVARSIAKSKAADEAWAALTKPYDYAAAAKKDDEIYNAFAAASPNGPLSGAGYRGSESNRMLFQRRESGGPWAASDAKVANTYATEREAPANVMPLRFDFQNPLVVRPGTAPRFSDIPIPGQPRGVVTSTDELARLARNKGHDGVVFQGIKDTLAGGGNPTTVYHALQRGTTYSPLTGELIYGLAPLAVGAGLWPYDDGSQ